MAIERAATGTSVEAGVRTVVEPAMEADTEVAEAVVDAAVVADFRSPVTGVPEVSGTAVTPPAGCPESAGVGRQNPCAVDPVVAGVRVPGPVDRRPDVAIAGAFGLVVL